MAPRFETAVWEHIIQIRQTGIAVVVVEQNTRRTLTMLTGPTCWSSARTVCPVRPLSC